MKTSSMWIYFYYRMNLHLVSTFTIQFNGLGTADSMWGQVDVADSMWGEVDAKQLLFEN